MKIKYQQGSSSTILCENRSIFGAVFGLIFLAAGIFLISLQEGEDQGLLIIGAIFTLAGLVIEYFGLEFTRIRIDTQQRAFSFTRKRWWQTVASEDCSLDDVCIRIATSRGSKGSTTYRIEFVAGDRVLPVTGGYDNFGVRGKYRDAQAIADASGISFLG